LRFNLSREIDFYWFSGTGNTLTVVSRMRDRFEEKGVTVTLKKIEKEDPSSVDCGKIIGLGFPVALQGTSPLVWDFIDSLPECSGTPVFMVDTLMTYSGGIIGPAGKILKRKGYMLLGAGEIKMPHNILVKRDASFANSKKIEKGLSKADSFASKIMDGHSVWRDIPFYSDFMSIFSKKILIWKLFRKIIPLKVDHEKCTRCRLCERLCPVNNWTLNSDLNKMEWGNGCIYCMRCFSFCPVNAIQYGNKKNVQYAALKASDLMKEK